VGITAFFTPPPGAPTKPRVSGFSTGRLEEIAALNPDLVITFSDVQAQLAADLIKRGLPVLATNQRTLEETEATLRLLGRVVDCEAEAERFSEFRERLAPASNILVRRRVYFEEWNDPFITGIAWVSELIERAGGDDIFSDLRTKRAAPERVVSSEQISARILKSFSLRGAASLFSPLRFPHVPAGLTWLRFAPVGFMKSPATIFSNPAFVWFTVTSGSKRSLPEPQRWGDGTAASNQPKRSLSVFRIPRIGVMRIEGSSITESTSVARIELVANLIKKAYA
jgi:hypothetical protein